MNNFNTYYLRSWLFGLLFINLFFGCKSIEVYDDDNEPIHFLNDISSKTVNKGETISVVSFNLEKAEKVDAAIVEFKRDSLFLNPDIILLQEMDEEAVQKFSDAFKCNYIYFPISKDKKSGKNFGNAILSKFKFENARKLILPSTKSNGRIRNATNAIIDFGHKKGLFYSIHLETIVMSKKKRRKQFEYLVDDIKGKTESGDIVIVGGDFNSIGKNNLDNFVSIFKELGFNWCTNEIGYTSKYLNGILKPKNDHIFSKGVEGIRSSKMVNSQTSDHLPIIMEFKFQ